MEPGTFPNGTPWLGGEKNKSDPNFYWKRLGQGLDGEKNQFDSTFLNY